jgi:hypothetical protein
MFSKSLLEGINLESIAYLLIQHINLLVLTSLLTQCYVLQDKKIAILR